MRRNVADATAREFIEPLTDRDLSLTVPYDGSFQLLRTHGLSTRHAVLRLAAHHYFHLGEMAAILGRAGHTVAAYPGDLPNTIDRHAPTRP